MGSAHNDVLPDDNKESGGNEDDPNRTGECNSGLVSELNINGDKGGEVTVRNLHSVPHIYREDVVRHKKSGVIGIVNEVAGDSDSDGSITDDDDDDDDEKEEEEEEEEEEEIDEDTEDEGGESKGENDGNASDGGNKGNGNSKIEILEADQVRVLWIDNGEQIQHVNDITVVDRGFLHGDYVASASNPSDQVGVVVDVNIAVDLLAQDQSLIKDVSTKDLKRVREFAVGDYVVLGPWLGRVDDVLDNVTVLVDDGSVCKVMGAEPQHLKPISKNLLDEDDHFPYYPGQRVRATSSSVFKDSRWLSGLWKANKLEGTVTKVTSGSVFVSWIASAGYGPDSSTSPPEEQNPKNLKLLSCFTHANWQVGDWCLLPSNNIQSPAVTSDNGLSKSGLHDPIKNESNTKILGIGCDSAEAAQEELDDINELMDIDPETVSEGNNGTNANNGILESSSCSSSLTSISKEPVHETWPLHRKKIRKAAIRREKKARRKEEILERALFIVNTRTRVDVTWQDGTISRGLDSTKLIPMESPGDHEFIAEQYVVERDYDGDDDNDNASEARRIGVIKSVNAKERTACVRWLKQVARPEDHREFGEEEVVSVYELQSHPDYDYSYGDAVVRLAPVSASLQIISDGEPVAESNQQTGVTQSLLIKKHSGRKTGEPASDNEGFMEFSDLSWVGNITGLRNGDIEVTWADGMISTVGPQAIFVVSRHDDDSIGAGSEVSDAAASWETMDDDEEEEMDGLENDREETGVRSATNMNADAGESLEHNDSGRNLALSLPFSAIEFVTRLASGIFSLGRKHTDFSNSKDETGLQPGGVTRQSNENDSSDGSSDESSIEKSKIIDDGGARCAQEQVWENAGVEAHESSVAAEILCNQRISESDTPICFGDEMSNFKNFDIAKDPFDHHFLSSMGQINNGRKWFKKVQQDWNILQKNLPDGIHVRVYEDRMDLLRAVIVGAYGTPYQDGLFFFDFHLPSEYPDVPPSAYYHSGGWRINPNLYEEGKVCLSLLNTWAGRGNEVWNSSSSILQVLVSLQGLVLNSKPYFNEAGYDKQIGTAEGEKNSLSYNENTFLLNCKAMMYLMRRPPKDFEELVKEHFRRRGYYILKAFDAYMRGYLIGSLTKNACVGDEDSSNSTSVGFKLMLAKIVPKLYSAFNEIGADCHEFKHLLPL